MKKIELFERWLGNQRISVIYERVFDDTDGLYLTDGSSAYIACAPEVLPKQKLAVLAHEAGHHFRGLTGDPPRDEERADRWAAHELISPSDIIQATVNGCQSYHELCETLDLDEEFVRTSIRCFRSMYGEGVEIDGYYLHLYPIWVKELETGRIWPEE